MKVTDVASREVAGIDLWWSRSRWGAGWGYNAGFEEAERLLSQAAHTNPGMVRLHGLDTVPEEQARRLYAEEVQPTASGHLREGSWDYRVARVFGSHSCPGCWTAREVPLLLLLFTGIPVPLAAPHETRKRAGAPRQLRTILDVLRMLSPDENAVFSLAPGLLHMGDAQYRLREPDDRRTETTF